MCGIFGLVGKRSVEVNRALSLGTPALAHRGPDDEGMELLPLAGNSEFCVGLGSRRLSIQDLSPAGHMPMKDPATGNWIRSEEHTSELQSRLHLVCRLLLE